MQKAIYTEKEQVQKLPEDVIINGVTIIEWLNTVLKNKKRLKEVLIIKSKNNKKWNLNEYRKQQIISLERVNRESKAF
jgi:hypothetical protein